MKSYRWIAMILCLCLLLSGCGPAESAPQAKTTHEPTVEPIVIEPIDDAYRNFYEVFVYSYADGDGDGIGDFKGLTEKLPYIYDMGFNGIWLMPIMPSPSYHKYDVTDYYGIDPQYGTMEDFKAFLDAAHALGIRVIIDLPVNHTSDRHPWFLEAKEDPASSYREYYVWSDQPASGYSMANGVYYESRFVSTMPDLNLDSEAVRAEIEKIIAFWLKEIGVDGFRLDAVTSYYTGAKDACVAFTSWLGETARAVRPECYIVGEAWTDLVEIGSYSEAAIDSFFAFPVAKQDGSIAKILGNAAKTPGQTYGELTIRLEETLAPHSIPAGFLGNHDTARPANFLGRSKIEKLKIAAGMLAMLPGNPFVYYGEEIGMIGKGEDPNKRIGMLWTMAEETTNPPPGATETEYALPSVAEQQADEASLLNYYRSAMWLRHKYPEIARGTSELLPCESTDACLIRRTYADSSIILAVNPSLNAVSLSIDAELLDTLCALEDGVLLENGVLTLPAYAIAILK